MQPTQPAGDRWTVVLPVKGGTAAKSRLGGVWSQAAVDGPQPPDAGMTTRLALAMALDCTQAVLAAPSVRRVVVVTADGVVAGSARALGADVVDQPDGDPGLAAAIRRGLAAAGTGPTAVLLADLPALRPQDVVAALGAASDACGSGAGWVFVQDAAGTGTVALAARDTTRLRPAFGPGSAAAHRAAGAYALALDLPRLRGDVDTPDDLAAAVALGVGHRTARTLHDMQATVLSWSSVEGTGQVVTDAGVRLPMAADALEGSGLRHLRPGQRVTCVATAADAAGRSGPVTGIRIHGIEG